MTVPTRREVRHDDDSVYLEHGGEGLADEEKEQRQAVRASMERR